MASKGGKKEKRTRENRSGTIQGVSQKKRDVHKFPPAILGPEMAAPILWAPCIFWFFLLENPMPVKFLLLGGGGVGVS